MGYQLFMVTLCTAALLSPYHGVRVVWSTVTSGGLAFTQFQTPATLVQPVGPTPFMSMVPSPLRSEGCCRMRIALGFTGFVPGAVGGATPRANPRASHSAVTG